MMKIKYLDDKLYFCAIEGRKVKTPERAHKTDAGVDIFAPLDMYELPLMPHQDALIDTGLRIHVPEGYAFVIKEKSGVSVKQKLIHGACLIDSNFQGEIKIHIINYSDTIIQIKPGQKLTQGILVPIETWDVCMIDEQDYMKKYSESERGENGFGSTGI